MAGFLSNPQAWGNGLSALGGALLTLGARPEDRSQVGMQALGNFQNMMMDQRRQKERDFLLNLEISDRARANQEREEAKRKQQEQEQAYKALLGGQAPANGFSQAQMGGAPQQPGPLGNLNDAQRQFLQAAGPQAGLGIIGQQLFQEPDNAAPKTVGGMMWDQQAGTYVPIPGYTEQAQAIAAAGRAPAQPKEPRKPGIITLYGKDGAPKSFFDTDPQIEGLLQQGWTEAAPKSGAVLAQIGTDAQGNPIFDYVAQAPKLTEDQSKAMNFASRMEASAPIIDELEQEGTSLAARAAQNVPFGLGNYLQTPNYQRFEQAKQDFMRSVLRKESGAVISEEEMKGGDKQYFPQPGDSPEVIEQKRQNRRVALEAMKSAAGPGAQLIPGIVDRSGTQAPDLKSKYGLE
jgi:hypothetical protein